MAFFLSVYRRLIAHDVAALIGEDMVSGFGRGLAYMADSPYVVNTVAVIRLAALLFASITIVMGSLAVITRLCRFVVSIFLLPLTILAYWIQFLRWCVDGLTVPNIPSFPMGVFLRRASEQVVKLKLESEVVKLAPTVVQHTPEVHMPGSNYFTIGAPSGQFAFIANGKPVGHGLRIGDFLVAPTHVVSQVSVIKASNSKGVSTLYDLSAFVWTELATDVSFLPLPAEVHLPKAKIGPVRPGMAQVTCNEENAGSVGQVSLLAFDLVAYMGSTRAGFSGTGYVQNGTVVALHLGGNGVANLGIPTELISLRLRAVTYQAESSDYDILMEKLSKGQRRQLGIDMRETGDPDMVEVQVKGRYYRIERDEYEDLIAEDEIDEEDRFLGDYSQKKTTKFGRAAKATAFKHRPVQLESAVQPAVDPVPEYDSGNGELPQISCGSRSPRVNPTGLVTPKDGDTTSSASPKKITPRTTGPAQILQQSPAASTIILESAAGPTSAPYHQAKLSALQSLASCTTDTESPILSPIIISELAKAVNGLTAASKTLIRQRGRDSGRSKTTRRSAKPSAGTASASTKTPATS